MSQTARNCMSHVIKEELMRRISDGIYQPGERLTELQIAREFKTSQAPVREALCELEIMGVVETEPYKGTRVREVTPRELEEAIQVRSAIESLAAESVDDRLKDQIDHLRARALETLEFAKKRDALQFALANIEFHKMIVKASNNRTLISTWENLAPELRMKACAKLNLDKLEEAAHDHLDIVDAFAEGDNRFAAKLLKKHSEAIITHMHEQELEKNAPAKKSMRVKETIS
jgi:DNA-binding GntR family transcriptional regulator